MYSAFLLTSSLLALSVNAIPAPQNAPAPGPDKCGPTTQNTGDPQDTCTTKPVIVTSASAFGTLASSDGQVWLYDWHTCDPTVQMICSQMADNATSGQVRHLVSLIVFGGIRRSSVSKLIPRNYT